MFAKTKRKTKVSARLVSDSICIQATVVVGQTLTYRCSGVTRQPQRR